VKREEARREWKEERADKIMNYNATSQAISWVCDINVGIR